MLIVSLTGGIATGKSIVARTLENLGCYVDYADKIAHRLMEPEKPAWRKIVSLFGPEILNTDKTINRLKLGAFIFERENDRNSLNKFIHPLVLEEKKRIIEKLRKEGIYKIFVSEAALTIEAGFAKFFNKIIVVNCRQEVQINRLMKRDKISREDALKKISAQMPSEQKFKFADYIIDTSGSISNTIEQTEQVFKNLMVDYKNQYEKREKKRDKRG
jgi:dephospho-CoA kinase